MDGVSFVGAIKSTFSLLLLLLLKWLPKNADFVSSCLKSGNSAVKTLFPAD
jgi:hypothetical protein